MGTGYLSCVKPHIRNILHILLKHSLRLWAFFRRLLSFKLAALNLKMYSLEGEKNMEYIWK